MVYNPKKQNEAQTLGPRILIQGAVLYQSRPNKSLNLFKVCLFIYFNNQTPDSIYASKALLFPARLPCPPLMSKNQSILL